MEALRQRGGNVLLVARGLVIANRLDPSRSADTFAFDRIET
jgi:hypothetical protein